MAVAELWLLIVLLCVYRFFPFTLQHAANDSPKRSRRPPSASSQLPATPLPGFFSAFPNASNFRCVACSKADKPGRPVGRPSRSTATHIREKISELDPSEPGMLLLLKGYAYFCLCAQHKRDDEVVDWKARLTEHWHAELKSLYQQLPCAPIQLCSFIQQRHGSRHIVISNRSQSWTDSPDCTYTSGAFECCVSRDLADLEANNDGSLGAEAPPQHSPLHQYGLLFRSLPYAIAAELDGNPGSKKRESKINPSFAAEILKPLGTLDAESGLIYAYKWKNDDEIIKIGYTTSEDDGKKRLREWKRCCKRDSISVYSASTPYAKRVETLIQTELASRKLRHRVFCKTKPQTRHTEWFRIEQEEAIRVIDYWTTWMTKQAPYDEKQQVLKKEKFGHMFSTWASIEHDETAVHFLSDSTGKIWPTTLTTDENGGVDGDPITLSDASNSSSQRQRMSPKSKPDETLREVSRTQVSTPSPEPSHRQALQSTRSEPIISSTLGILDHSWESNGEETPSKAPKGNRSTQSRRRKSAPVVKPTESHRIRREQQRASTRSRKVQHSKGDASRPSIASTASVESKSSDSNASYAGSETDTSEVTTAATSLEVKTKRTPGSRGATTSSPSHSALSKIGKSPASRASRRSSAARNAHSRESSSKTSSLNRGHRIASELEKEYRWECPDCTYDNSAFVTCCEMCHHVILEINDWKQEEAESEQSQQLRASSISPKTCQEQCDLDSADSDQPPEPERRKRRDRFIPAADSWAGAHDGRE